MKQRWFLLGDCVFTLTAVHYCRVGPQPPYKWTCKFVFLLLIRQVTTLVWADYAKFTVISPIRANTP